MIRFALTTTLALAATSAFAQETPVDETARLQLEQLRLNVEKARLEPLAALRSQTGNTATVAGQADTAETLMLKYAVYRRAVHELVAGLPDGSSEVEPIVVFGSVPPTLSDWFAFQENARTTSTALSKAIDNWTKAKPSKGSHFLVGAVPVAVLTTVLSLLRTDSSITGSTIKAEDAAISTMLASELSTRGYKIDFADFAVSRTGVADADFLLGLKGIATDEMGLDKLAEKAVAALDEFNGAKKSLTDAVKAAADNTDPDASIALETKAKAASRSLAAGESLQAAVATYNTLRAGLLSSTNGIANAVATRRQMELSTANDTTRPVLYILNRDGALTTVSKKGALVGLLSNPAKFRVAVRVDYLWLGQAPKRESIGCLSEPISFDDIGKVAPATACPGGDFSKATATK